MRLYPISLAFKDQPNDIPVVVYHGIEKNTKKEHYLTGEDFINQLKYFKKNNYTPITIREYISILNGKSSFPKKPIVLTFHDNHYGQYRYAFKYLKEYDFKASFFVVAKWTKDNNIKWAMSWDEIKKINSYKNIDGNKLFDIEAHSLAHAALTRKKGETLIMFEKRMVPEIRDTRLIIGEKIGTSPKVFALPGGANGPGWEDKSEYKIILKLLKKYQYTGLQTGHYFTKNNWSISGISVHNIGLKDLELEFILNRGKQTNYLLDYLKWLLTVANRSFVKFKIGLGIY